MNRRSQPDAHPDPPARVIADAAPIGIFRADPDGRITYINPALERISGVRAARALGQSWLRSAPVESREQAERDWRAAIAAGEDWAAEFRFKHPDGAIRYASILMTAEPAEAGRPAGFVGFVHDITEQKRARAELKRSERLFRALAENATDIIVRLDLDDHIIYASPAMVEVTGFSAEECIGINPISFMHPDDFPAAKERSRQLKTGEISQAVIEYRTPHKSGHYIWVEARSRLVRDSSGQPSEVISVVRDISESKRLEAELIAAREAERQASAAQSRFLSTMSHEIRTPITGVIGMIDLLINAKSEDERPRYRAALALSARTLLRVVDDVLDYSKWNSVGVTLESSPFDMLATVRGVVDLYRPAAEDKGLTLGLQVHAAARQVIGDPTRLCQVLGNLVANAIKFTHEGRVDIDVRQEGSRWTFAVTDTGMGISGERQRELFHAFAQADDSIGARFGGTGLGLVIARLIVEAMGGSITVQSELGQGARFTFSVTMEQAAEIPASTPQEETNLQDFKSLNVVIADDNEVNLLYLGKLLERMGHRVTAVTDGAAAVEAVRAGDFDAVLMDRHMPRMDGEEAARAIRALPLDRPVLLVSVSAAVAPSHDDGGNHAAGLFDASVPKPIRAEQLQILLAHWARHARIPPQDSRSAAEADGSLSAEDEAELKRIFRLDLRMRIDLIERALADHDLAAVQRQAHAIAGAAFLVNERGIAELASSVWTGSNAATKESARELYQTCLEYLR